MGFSIGNEIVYLALFSKVLLIRKAVDVPTKRQQIAESPGMRPCTKSATVSHGLLLSECVEVAYHVIVA